jgi:hypothetical protein
MVKTKRCDYLRTSQSVATCGAETDLGVLDGNPKKKMCPKSRNRGCITQTCWKVPVE